MKNLRTLLFAVLLFALSGISNAQSVGINADGSAPNSSAMLDVRSTSKGFLAPRMTSAERGAIGAPATGLLVYQTDGTAGFYYYNGAAWSMVGTGSLDNTSVTAGSYTRASITVDAQGRITAAGNGEPISLTSGVTGILPVANGGTGSGTQNFVDLLTNQTVGGGKFFSSDLTVKGLAIGTSNYNNQNTVMGYQSLVNNSGGANNTAMGFVAMNVLTTGSQNNGIGSYALHNNSTGDNNTGIGSSSLGLTTASGNTGIGASSLHANVTGSNNSAFGFLADVGSSNLANATAIGYGAVVSVSNTIQLGNANITNIKTSGTLTTGDVTYPKTDGFSGQILTTNGNGTPAWTTPSTTATAYSGTLPVANGGTGTITGSITGTTALIFAAGGTNQNVTLTPTGTGYTLLNGNVGIGIDLPSYTLHVNGSVAGTSAYNNLSDERLKKDVLLLENGLSKIMALRPITFNWNKTVNPELKLDDRNHLGFIAQEVETVLPQAVSTAYDAMKTKLVAYSDLVPVLTKAVQEQQATIQKQQTAIEAQQKQIDELKRMVDRLMKK